MLPHKGPDDALLADKSPQTERNLLDGPGMKYALVNGERAEASPRLKGACPSCGADLVARCGEINVNHWAHKNRRNCDTFWENETDWHREWKNLFPISWQEVVMNDPVTGERHIADVRTKDGFVLEFQHSFIKQEEQRSRERFYKKMAWVLNGSRRKNDYKRFMKGFQDFRATKQKGIFGVSFPDEAFPKAWVNASVPVFIDFAECAGGIWGILPGRQNGNAISLCVSKRQLVDFAIKGDLFDKLEEINKNSRK